jgi:abnormal spindle-like microcephaly-associated protein
MADVRLRQQAMEALSAYHPFWLRLGLEIVVGRAVPPAGGRPAHGRRSRAELEAFAREHFLADADLALQRAGNKAIKGLHGPQYWVGLLIRPLCLQL